MRYLFMCRSLTYAQRAARALERAGISASVIKAPQSVSGSGCGYCVSVSGGRENRAAQILRNDNLLQGKIYLMDTDSELREVFL